MSWQVGGNCFLTLSGFLAADSNSLFFLPVLPLFLALPPTAVSLPMFNWVSDGSEGRKEGDEKLRRGKDRVVLLVGKEGKQRGGDMRETDEKNEWRDERGR